MGDIHVRNLYCYVGTNYSQTPERAMLWMARELYLVGRWTVADIDAAAEWDSASNILLPLTDFSVTAASPYYVTSSTGGFVAGTHEGKMLTLFASNDNIRGIYNVKKVLDSNTLYVDPRTRAGAWPSDESGITGRIHNASVAAPLTSTGSYVVMQAPAASGSNLQVKFNHNSSTLFYITAYPLGDYLSTANATFTKQITINSSDLYLRINAYFQDASVGLLSMWYSYLATQTNAWRMISAGELTDTLAGDTNPGFVQAGDMSYLSDTSTDAEMMMLNEVNTATRFYPTFWKRWDADDDSYKRDSQPGTLRMNGGKVKVFRPMIIGANNADGGFFRGVDPRTYTHQSVSGLIDEFGTDWWFIEDHTLVPRDGTNDLIPIAGVSF